MESNVWEDHGKEYGLNSPVGQIDIMAEEPVFL